MNSNWMPPDTEMDHAELMGAASRVLDFGTPGLCPLCRATTLRFYCQKYDFEPSRGAVWVWCPACGRFTHISRIEFEFDFVDPFVDWDDKDAPREDRDNWLDQLNKLWEQNKIPRELRVRKT